MVSCFFLKSVFSVSVSVRNTLDSHPSSSSYPHVSLGLSATKCIRLWADGAGRLILTSGRLLSSQGQVRARRRSENLVHEFILWFSVGHQQSQLVRRGLSGAQPPPIHPKAACQRHHHLLLASARGLGINDLGAPLATQPIFRLEF